MKNKQFFQATLAAFIIFFTSCNNNDKKKETEMKEPKLKEENVTYAPDNMKDSLVLDGYIVYDENVEGKRPAVLVVHEWWGLNDYAKMRARELAKLGYIAMAVDMFGNGKRADNPDAAGALAGPFYQNPQLAKPLFEAALIKLKTYSQTDPAKVGAIGYCFGGAQVLNMAKFGEDLKGVVSFHGNLTVVPVNKDLLKAEILVCHGAADPFVPQAEVGLFKAEMDSIGAKYSFKAYEGATHAFTNPNATAMGEKFSLPIKYNAAADSASWKDMKEFFQRIFR
ncbi:MAG: dienelactone hydrolase family protein [Chitinophagaceae bacterium]|nr:dienelactone hydrolase family protein [Chitinophagaceae bacterium]MBK9570141.1 dienelactone hydrolase family protein [Chitinophagaceae bacterium]